MIIIIIIILIIIIISILITIIIITIVIVIMIITTIERSLEVKLPTIWTDGKAEMRAVRDEKESEEKVSVERRSRWTKM